ncbi:MAG: VCBS repeat-containing protein [Gemmatimonadota bacterium]|nr:VCBS repeat-containing protein [Gemmatimonadota bacterium]
MSVRSASSPGARRAAALPLRAALPVVVALPLLAACASAGGPTERAGAAEPSAAPGPQGTAWWAPPAPDPAVASAGLVRRVYGPVVSDPDGATLAHPWLGGLNQPRPQAVDADGDGDLDLFVQERTGRVALFENTGTPREPRFVWRTDRFRGLDVGEWFRFVDVDGDGAPDLMGEARFSHVRLWRNEGGGVFRAWADSLRDATGAPLFSDRQNIPNALDFDCDGRLDLFVGRLTGTISHFAESAPDPATGAPRFALVTDRFQNVEIVGQVGSMHGANTLAVGDVDGDGDADILWGDFFEPGLLLLRNEGTCGRPRLAPDPLPFPPGDPLRTSGYNAPALADLDGDGRPELLVGVLGGAFDPNRTTVENLLLLVRGAGGWEVTTRRLIGTLDVGDESVPALGDWDGDGDPDLLVGNRISDDGDGTARVHAFENVGEAGRPRFRDRGPLPIGGAFHFAPALGDLDGDGDPDLLLGTFRQGILAFRFDGPEVGWTPLPEATISLSRGSHATPALGDLDGDGDLDLVAGEGSGELNYWRNGGSPSRPVFDLVTDRLGGIDAGRRSHPHLVDWDGDGRLDLLLGSEDEALALWRGVPPQEGPDGTLVPAFARVESFAPPVPADGAAASLDIDGDGDLDLLAGGAGGGLVLLENVGP